MFWSKRQKVAKLATAEEPSHFELIGVKWPGTKEVKKSTETNKLLALSFYMTTNTMIIIYQYLLVASGNRIKPNYTLVSLSF